jgi:hypothetical protein
VEGPSIAPPSVPIIPQAPSPAPEPGPGPARGGIPTSILVVVGAALIAAFGLLLLMPGGDDGSTALSPIAQAAETTAAVSGARFEGSGTGSFEGGSMTMNFNGVYDGTNQRSQMTMNANVSGGPQSISTSMSAVQEGLVVYMSSPLFAGQLPNGAQWMRIDGSQLGADAADLRESNSMDGRQVLEQLSEVSGSTQTNGLEKVRGATTTHYQATLDPDKLGAGAISDSTGGAADVWVDRKGLVRRVDMRIWVALPGGTPTQMSMTVEYFDFGIHPNIAVPAAADTVDFTQLSQQAVQAAG